MLRTDGWTDARTYNMKTVYPPQQSLGGGGGYNNLMNGEFQIWKEIGFMEYLTPPHKNCELLLHKL